MPAEATMMYSMGAQIVVSFLLLAVASGANGLLLGLLARFKALQTTSNVLIVDLAVVDLLNVLINVPLFMCYGVMDLEVFRGKLISWFVGTLHVLFAYLTLTTMCLMMMHRFLAIRFPVYYQAKKTRTRVLMAILVKWLLSVITVIGVYAYLFKIDLGNSPVEEYRASYNKESKAVIPRIFAPAILVVSICLYMVCRRTLKATSRNLQRIQDSAVEKGKQKAINTILIVVVIFCASYVPEILRSSFPLGLAGKHRQWLQFALNVVLFLPSTINPFIYFVRVTSFRRAFKGLFARSRVGGHADEIEGRGRRTALRRERMLSPRGTSSNRPSGIENFTPVDASSSNNSYAGTESTSLKENSIADTKLWFSSWWTPSTLLSGALVKWTK